MLSGKYQESIIISILTTPVGRSQGVWLCCSEARSRRFYLFLFVPHTASCISFIQPTSQSLSLWECVCERVMYAIVCIQVCSPTCLWRSEGGHQLSCSQVLISLPWDRVSQGTGVRLAVSKLQSSSCLCLLQLLGLQVHLPWLFTWVLEIWTQVSPAQQVLLPTEPSLQPLTNLLRLRPYLCF